MEGLGQYALAVCAGAMLVSLAQSLSGQNSQVRWVCGLVLIVQILTPIRQLEVRSIRHDADSFAAQAEEIAAQGREEAAQQLRAGIIERTAAYILDEAEAMGVTLQVTALSLDKDSLAPCGVELGGHISPYNRQQLSDWLTEELGIGKEEQCWMEPD